MPGEIEKFYIGIFKEDGAPIGHTSAPKPEDAASLQEDKKIETTYRRMSTEKNTGFAGLFNSLIGVMEIYRSFIPLTLSLGPAIAPVLGSQRLEKFAKRNGAVIGAHSGENHTVYELSLDHLKEFLLYQDEVLAATRGASHVPEVMIIGLISSYDAFLSNLLKLVFELRPEIIFKSDKSIPFSEISDFTSMIEAKQYLIDKEVEAVIRQSHQEHFAWMEKNLSVKLKEGLDIWPNFVELCERRNLLTHTGGVVSQQYLKNCKIHKVDVKGVKAGEKLGVDPSYFSGSVNAVYEVGIKLCYVMWRKFDPTSADNADKKYNGLCFDLIFNRSYQLAEQLLKFGVQVLKQRGGSERTRRMMLVNLANSIRLQDRKEEAKRIIEEEDWSAVSSDFRLCANAVSGNIDEVLKLMKAIGPTNPDVTAEDYRVWPVFREHRKDKKFIDTFKEVFDEDLIKPTSAIVTSENIDKTEADDVAAGVSDQPKCEEIASNDHLGKA